MKKMNVLVGCVFAMGMYSVSALAAVKTVSLSVPGMYCAVCPITVKKALEKVPGVTGVEVSFEKKEAQVTYDDTKANVSKLEDATFEAGYPSHIKGAKDK